MQSGLRGFRRCLDLSSAPHASRISSESLNSTWQNQRNSLLLRFTAKLHFYNTRDLWYPCLHSCILQGNHILIDTVPSRLRSTYIYYDMFRIHSSCRNFDIGDGEGPRSFVARIEAALQDGHAGMSLTKRKLENLSNDAGTQEDFISCFGNSTNLNQVLGM